MIGRARFTRVNAPATPCAYAIKRIAACHIVVLSAPFTIIAAIKSEGRSEEFNDLLRFETEIQIMRIMRDVCFSHC